MKIRNFLTILFLFSIISCGVKGDPVAPEVRAPDVVRYLDVKPKKNSLVFTWQPPLTNAKGEELRDLAGFLVKKSNYVKGEKSRFEEVALREFDADKINVKSAPTFNFEDKKVEKGSVYQYMVVPFNDDGVEGERATVITVKFEGVTSSINRF